MILLVKFSELATTTYWITNLLKYVFIFVSLQLKNNSNTRYLFLQVGVVKLELVNKLFFIQSYSNEKKNLHILLI
jgi:hypothetical protein